MRQKPRLIIRLIFDRGMRICYRYAMSIWRLLPLISRATYLERALLFLAIAPALACGQTKLLWKETFEDEDFRNRWHWEENTALWAVGAPTAGPGRACIGQRCAGVVLNGDYPSSADTRFVRDEVFRVP